MEAEHEQTTTIEFDVTPDRDGIVDGCELAEAMIIAAYEYVSAYAYGARHRADQLFNGMLLRALNTVALGAEDEKPLKVRIAAPGLSEEQIKERFKSHQDRCYHDMDYIEAWYKKFLHVAEQSKEERFAPLAVLNRHLETIDRYRRVCADARDCIELLAQCAGVETTKSITELYYKLGEAEYDVPMRLKPFPRPDEEELFKFKE